jgi:hypothetical protein
LYEDFTIHPFPALNAPFRNTTDSPWQVTDDILAFISLIRTFVSDFSSNTLTLRVRSRLSWDTCVQDWPHVYETVRYIPAGFLLQLLAGQSRPARFGIAGRCLLPVGVDTVLRVSVRYQATLEYFTIPSRQPCAELWVRTYQTETMDGSSGGSSSDRTFRIGNNQDICLIHVSAVPTSISITYSTEQSYDYLSWMLDDSHMSVTLTGIGSTNGIRFSCSWFSWHSDSSQVSSRVLIMWQSWYSDLRQHHHWFAVTNDAFALSDSVTPTSTDWSYSSDSSLLAIVLPIAGVIILVSVIAAVCCRLRRKKQQTELRDELTDIPPTEPMGPVFVGASTAIPEVPARPNDPHYAPQYAACPVVG